MNTDVGFTGNLNHTQAFVVERENYVDFMNELLTNDEKYKCIEYKKITKIVLRNNKKRRS